MDSLPGPKKMLLKAFLTMRRSKKLNGESYNNKLSLNLKSLSSKQLTDYQAFFDFKNTVPLSYFYLLSQKAQLALMIQKDFPLPIPGMIHLETKINQIKEIDQNASFEISSEVEITNKKEGSLIPVFKEDFYQNGEKVIEIQSLYLVKRKSPQKAKAKRENTIIENKESNWINFKWRIPGLSGFKYAKLSGDYNPIHLCSLIAWFSGFKWKITHGWYLASRIVSQIEEETNMPAKSFQIQFIRAIPSPSKVEMEFRLSHNRNLQFRIREKGAKHYSISGHIE